MVYKGVDRITPRDGTGDNKRLNRRYKRKWNAAMNESANWKTLFSLLSPSFAVEILILSRGLSFHLHVSTLRLSVQVQKHVCLVCYVDIYKHSVRRGDVINSCELHFASKSCHEEPIFTN